jgi:hypothetical protein
MMVPLLQSAPRNDQSSPEFAGFRPSDIPRVGCLLATSRPRLSLLGVTGFHKVVRPSGFREQPNSYRPFKMLPSLKAVQIPISRRTSLLFPALRKLFLDIGSRAGSAIPKTLVPNPTLLFELGAKVKRQHSELQECTLVPRGAYSAITEPNNCISINLSRGGIGVFKPPVSVCQHSRHEGITAQCNCS